VRPNVTFAPLRCTRSASRRALRHRGRAASLYTLVEPQAYPTAGAALDSARSEASMFARALSS
jgi:hypothetical protein